MFYTQLPDKKVRCELCPHHCIIDVAKRGLCRNRENQNGKLITLVYNKPCSYHREPIEKAPFYHFLPGTMRITIATTGCNQQCKYCQNWPISQANVEDVKSYYLTPSQIVQDALRESIPIICFTYTEPIVFYEYMYDIAVLARKAGIKTAVVSGGFINPKPLLELCKVVDAIKIDLKGFEEDFYRKVCASQLQPVLDALKIIAQSNIHLEIVNLIVPTLNDDTATIKQMCLWIKDNLGTDIPLHFSRFFPNYKLQNLPPTPIITLETAASIAKQVGLNYVYLGNVLGHQLENTYCPKCHKLLIARKGYMVVQNHIQDNKCKYCGHKIYGVFK
ncbi:MAG: AmmeMemoRadiSam system radical SAM enzyme [candidate division WOR-3 bacterium]